MFFAQKALGIFRTAFVRRRRALGIFRTAFVNRQKALAVFRTAFVSRRKALGVFRTAFVNRRKALGVFRTTFVSRWKTLGVFQTVFYAVKVAISILIPHHASAGNLWIAERLGMGHDQSVSRLIKQGKDAILRQCKQREKMFPCVAP
jgi:hypothetical protein